MVTPKLQKKIEDSTEHLYTVDYTNYNYVDDRPTKQINSNNRRKVDFRKEHINGYEKHEENERSHENIPNARRKKFRNESTHFCSNDGFYLTDRGGEADDENSQHGERVTRKHDLDEKPQRENPLCEKCSDDSEVFDYYNDIYMERNLNNQFKPALLRAVNWIFGGCPEATRRAALERDKVGKEESQGLTDEWLL